jgi:ribosomal RNA-processing protein 12
LSTVVDALPKDQLHLIPELLSEAVLGTKEVNEKARDAGFDLLVVMGHKMAQGGVVKQVATGGDDAMENGTSWSLFALPLNPADDPQQKPRRTPRSTSLW